MVEVFRLHSNVFRQKDRKAKRFKLCKPFHLHVNKCQL